MQAREIELQRGLLEGDTSREFTGITHVSERALQLWKLGTGQICDKQRDGTEALLPTCR